MKLFAPIAKIDEETRLVFGYASTERLDSQGEIVKKEAIEAALPDYMRFANIREMHQPSAVGVAREAELDDRGLHLCAHVVDDEAWAKVTAGVYKGFSIGGRVTKRDPDAAYVITGVDLLEISLVDRPANPEAVIELYKRAAHADDVVKAGARHSREDLARVQQLHDVAVALGADCPGAMKHAFSDELRKRVEAQEHDAVLLAKFAAAVAPLNDELASLRKRVGDLEAQPLPPLAAVTTVAVAKEQDGGAAGAAGETVADFVARLHGLPAEARALELTKLALRFPQPLARAPTG